MLKPKRLNNCFGGVYKFNNRVIGVVQMDTVSSIENIVTHPAFYACGGALIEFAVRIPVLNGGQGFISLYAASQEAALAYSKPGFLREKHKQSEGPGMMLLKPKGNDTWSPVPYQSSAGPVTTYSIKNIFEYVFCDLFKYWLTTSLWQEAG